MIKEFNTIEEIQKYYDEEHNAYIFKENNEYIDKITFNFNLDVEADIYAIDIYAKDINASSIYAYDIYANNIKVWNIKANNINSLNIDALYINAKDIDTSNIKARDIYANNITARDIYSNYITADNINYYAVCFAYIGIKCKSIKGRRENAKHFVLDGELEVLEMTSKEALRKLNFECIRSNGIDDLKGQRFMNISLYIKGDTNVIKIMEWLK